jgi:hypothetical protein
MDRCEYFVRVTHCNFSYLNIRNSLLITHNTYDHHKTGHY